jgi:hypothetical protein
MDRIGQVDTETSLLMYRDNVEEGEKATVKFGGKKGF